MQILWFLGYINVKILQCLKVRLTYRCIKLGFTSDNYPVDRPNYFYSKWHAFEHYAWFAFGHVYRMPINCKIAHNYFAAIFLSDSPEALSCFRCKLFCNRNLLFELWNSHHTYLLQQRFWKSSMLNNLKRFHHIFACWLFG